MASASKSTTLYCPHGNAYTLTASFTENSTSTANNTSSITCTATLTSTNAYWSSSASSTLIIYWHDNKQNYDRQVASISLKTITLGGSKSASATITVTHKDDGTLSGYAKAVFTKGDTNQWTPKSGSVSTNNTALTTIARASQPTVTPSTFNIGDTITINTNRKSTAFTHTITLYFGNYSYQIATGVTDTITFDTSTIANQMYQQIPNASVGVGNVTAVTYNGSTQIGSKNVLFYANVTNSNPTFNTAYLDTNSTTTAITSNNQQIIRNNSTLQVNITNAEAKNYATLSSATCLLNGTTYNATISGTSATFNIGTVNIASDTTAVVTVTDSRGISTSQNLNITILDWVLPTAIINLQRENNFYSETNINVNAEYSSLDSKNTISIKVRYKKVDDSTYGSYTTLQDEVTTQLTLDNNYAWNVQVLLEDAIGSTTYNLVLDRGIPIAFFDRLKRSVGINCFPADNESLEVSDENILTRILGYGQVANQVTGDWDTACGTASGIYMGNGLTNSPSGTTVDGWWWVIHIVHNDMYQRQIAYSFLSNSEVYTRIQNNGTWNSWTNVAGSGGGGTSDYALLTNKPSINGVTLSGNKTTSDIGISIPTTTSELTNNSGFITNAVDNLSNYTKTSDLHAVATSGSYNDLSNKPTIPSKTSDLTNDAGYLTGITSNDVTTALGYTPLENKVFDYSDILSITSTSDNTFTEIVYCIDYNIPFRITQISGDVFGYQVLSTYVGHHVYAFVYKDDDNTLHRITMEYSSSSVTITETTQQYQEEITSTNKLDYSLIDNTPTIPTKTSDLTNDSGFLSAKYLFEIDDIMAITSFTDEIYNDLWDALNYNKPVVFHEITSTPSSNSNHYYDVIKFNNRGQIYFFDDENKYNCIEIRYSLGTGMSVTRTKTEYQEEITSTNKLDYSLLSNTPTIPTVPTNVSAFTNDAGYLTSETDPVFTASASAGITSTDISNWDAKQEALVSGTNIKTINNQSLLGSGNITIQSGGGGTATDVQINGSSIVSNDVANLSVEGTYNASTNKIATEDTIITTTGELSLLNTTTQTDLVHAVNEVNTKAGVNETAIGDLSTLDTSDKGDLVSAINEVNSNMNYGAILFNSTSGTNADITLSDTTANYQYIEIFYRTSDSGYSSVKVYEPNGKEVNLISQTAVNTTPRVYGQTKRIAISGNSITNVSTSVTQYTINNNATGYVQTQNYIYITRVIGYTNTVIPNEIDSASPITLYTNTSGSTASITLNDSVSNYSYIEIFYGWNGGSFGLCSTKVDTSLTNDVNLSQTVYNNSYIYHATSKWSKSGTNLSVVGGEYWRFGTSGNPTRTQTQNIAIFKVIGYK